MLGVAAAHVKEILPEPSSSILLKSLNHEAAAGSDTTPTSCAFSLTESSCTASGLAASMPPTRSSACSSVTRCAATSPAARSFDAPVAHDIGRVPRLAREEL